MLEAAMNRLFETVYILLNRKSATVKEHAEHFGVSRSTICRNVDALTLEGTNIAYHLLQYFWR